MDCSLPGSSVHEVTRVGHDLATKPPLPPPITELVAPTFKNLPAMQEIHVLSLSREDPPGEGNGNPLQYSCLENPMDRGT